MKAVIKRTGTYPIIDNVCFTQQGYSATQDLREPYLGNNLGFIKKPTVVLTAMFEDKYDVEMLMSFWRNELDEGQNIFMTQTEIFGKNDMYGLRQISAIKHTKQNGIDVVTFSCEIMFDSSTIHNTPPNVQDMTIHVRKNSIDNFITLFASDKDGDPISFEIQVGSAIGNLSGIGNNLYYTPDHDVEGTDCFSYVARDYWGQSNVGVVTVIIDDYGMPTAEVEYKVSGDITVSGNYFYDLGNGIWFRGTGGSLSPIAHTIKIRSDDHKVNASFKYKLSSITIIKWGDRTDWSELCSGSGNIRNFSISSSAGVCLAINVNDMFHGSGIKHIAFFDMSNVTSMHQFAYVSKVVSIPDLNIPKVEDISYAFAGCGDLGFVGILKTPNCKYFTDLFLNCGKLSCLGGIDTRNKISTANMFNGTKLLINPNKTTEQGAILNGDLWLSKSPCLFAFATPSIIHVSGSEICHLATPKDKCKSKGEYKVQLVRPAPTGSVYVWTSNATITKGQNTDTVEVETALSDIPVQVWLQCEITESGKVANTGKQTFIHSRTSDYLTLTLPKSYTPINLRHFIDANNPHHDKVIVITNNVTNCHVDTGDLTGLDVKLINNGYLQGYTIPENTKKPITQSSGFSATSPITLINNGHIYGAGGWGGKGHKGEDYAEVVTWNLSSQKPEKLQYFGNGEGHGGTFYSGVYRWHDKTNANNIAVQWFYRSNGAKHVQKNPNVVDLSHTFYENNGNTKITLLRFPDKFNLTSKPPHYVGVAGWLMSVKIYHKHVKPKRVGGIGGVGGHGIGYGRGAKIGEAGATSTPMGGHSGGRGGTGGGWGAVGYVGNVGGGNTPVGEQGYPHAYGITGKTHLKTGSVTGSVLGGII